MRIDWWTLALQAVNVLVLIWLLSRFLYRPVAGMIEARQAAARALLDDAQAAKDKAVQEEAAMKAARDAVAADAERLKAELKASLDRDRAAALDDARKAAAQLRDEAAAVQARQGKAMMAALEDKAAVLAGHMAEKLLRRIPADIATEAMFKALVDEIAARPQAEREALGASAQLEMISAWPADAVAQARWQSELAGVLPGLGALRFRADPGLIAGVELHGPHAMITNSWRADLDTLLHEIKEGRDDAPVG